MKRILVTGGAGYIGSHTAKHLARHGYEPVVFDNLATGHRWAVAWGPLIEGDLSDRAALRRALHGIDAVMHFAAHAFVGESMLQPAKYFHNNTVNTLNLLEAMLDQGVNTLIFSSSCATYGIPSSLPITEAHPQNPVNPYGESKRMAEQLIRWFGEVHGLRWIALRYFNAAGADPDGDLGEAHSPEPHLVPNLIAAALGHQPALDVFGTDYDTPDGTASRDYIHVSDLAEAHLLALKQLELEPLRLALNLGSGRATTIRQMVSAAEDLIGREVPVRHLPRRPGDPPSLLADFTLARQLLGWQPCHSSTTEILSSALAWHTRCHSRGATP